MLEIDASTEPRAASCPPDSFLSRFDELEASDALALLGADPAEGLTDSEASRRLSECGPNELVELGVRNHWLTFLGQFKATLVVVLIIAALLSILLGDLKDSVAILAIIVLNAVLGFVQEHGPRRRSRL